jgi:hypothetical protein
MCALSSAISASRRPQPATASASRPAITCKPFHTPSRILQLRLRTWYDLHHVLSRRTMPRAPRVRNACSLACLLGSLSAPGCRRIVADDVIERSSRKGESQLDVSSSAILHIIFVLYYMNTTYICTVMFIWFLILPICGFKLGSESSREIMRILRTTHTISIEPSRFSARNGTYAFVLRDQYHSKKS